MVSLVRIRDRGKGRALNWLDLLPYRKVSSSTAKDPAEICGRREFRTCSSWIGRVLCLSKRRSRRRGSDRRRQRSKPRRSRFCHLTFLLLRQRRMMVFLPRSGQREGQKWKHDEEKEPRSFGMEKARNILEDMPCVSTRDVGADGKRVEGFLYWYGGSKEEVKIVCVCHGSFLSPAEFVRHGGGTVADGGDDVTSNPLRHIVVKLPSSSL
ncbi:Jas TPL-binding domain protein [Raphanus sativus]|nr:Jas TPL-binding domain protein [Raphanus sativus]